MIYKHEIDHLNDEEKVVLLYALNEMSETGVKVDIHTVRAYKKEAFVAKLRAAKERVKSGHVDFFCDMCRKLNIDL